MKSGVEVIGKKVIKRKRSATPLGGIKKSKTQARKLKAN